jgi:transcriptional antiterminator RfaH
MEVMVSASSSTVSPFVSPASARTRAPVIQPLLDACGLGWFCLRGEGRREHLAALNLARRNAVEAFAPRIRLRRESRAGVQTVTEALFPGYLFARFRYPEQVRHVVSTSGVLGLVAFGGPPPRLDDGTIAQLRQHAQAFVSSAPVSPIFEEGDWVRVAAGCFRGTEGRVRPSAAGVDRVCVLLSLLGHEVEISLPADQLVSRTEHAQLVPPALRAHGAIALDRVA